MSAAAAYTCPACGSTGTDHEIRVPDHEYGVSFVATYVRCSSCGSEFQAPMPDDATLGSFYPEDYHSMSADGLLVRIRNAMRWKRLAALLPADGVLLDYGCGEGQFLRYAAEQAPERSFFGYEIAPEREVREDPDGRVTIVRGTPEDLLDVLPACGLVTMNHVIEHLPEPTAILRRLVDRLVPGGVLEGQTPAAGSLEQSVFGHRWSGYHAPRHTVVFSRSGLAHALERSGLATPEIRGTFNPAGLALSLASLRHGEEGGALQRSGPTWLAGLAAASGLSIIDLLSGRPAVVDFAARRPAENPA